ncbi:MAG: hypothetical protein HW390_625 [Candidatus Brocadiaceae bacterium]|nr:hypothetical protein [Candidatus Brocadiaceae bacterium]
MLDALFALLDLLVPKRQLGSAPVPEAPASFVLGYIQKHLLVVATTKE